MQSSLPSHAASIQWMGFARSFDNSFRITFSRQHPSSGCVSLRAPFNQDLAGETVARPQTLAEVAQIARTRPLDFAMALDEFVDEFYLDHGDKGAQQQRLNAAPEPVGDPCTDAWIGAAGEHLALRWNLAVPAWTQHDHHFALEQPVFSPDSAALRG